MATLAQIETYRLSRKVKSHTQPSPFWRGQGEGEKYLCSLARRSVSGKRDMKDGNRSAHAHGAFPANTCRWLYVLTLEMKSNGLDSRFLSDSFHAGDTRPLQTHLSSGLGGGWEAAA